MVFAARKISEEPLGNTWALLNWHVQNIDVWVIDNASIRVLDDIGESRFEDLDVFDLFAQGVVADFDTNNPDEAIMAIDGDVIGDDDRIQIIGDVWG